MWVRGTRALWLEVGKKKEEKRWASQAKHGYLDIVQHTQLAFTRDASVSEVTLHGRLNVGER